MTPLVNNLDNLIGCILGCMPPLAGAAVGIRCGLSIMIDAGSAPEDKAKQSSTTSAPAGSEPTEGCGQILREGVTAVIALAIVFVVLWLLFDTHYSARMPDAAAFHHRQKEILALALGLLGTVMGYYFGRVPAERHADAARSAERMIRQKVHAGLTKIQQHLKAPPDVRGIDEVNAEIERLRSSL